MRIFEEDSLFSAGVLVDWLLGRRISEDVSNEKLSKFDAAKEDNFELDRSRAKRGGLLGDILAAPGVRAAERPAANFAEEIRSDSMNSTYVRRAGPAAK